MTPYRQLAPSDLAPAAATTRGAMIDFHTSRTQDRLRQAALDLFLVNGYQSTSLRDLASSIGVHAGSLYNHIENKQSLLFELIEECMDDLLNLTRRRLKRALPGQSRVHLFIQAFIDFQAGDKKRLILLGREKNNLSKEQQQRIYNLRGDYLDCLKRVIHAEAGIPEREEIELRFLASSVIGMLESFVLWDHSFQSLSNQEVVERFTNMVARAISPPREQRSHLPGNEPTRKSPASRQLPSPTRHYPQAGPPGRDG